MSRKQSSTLWSELDRALSGNDPLLDALDKYVRRIRNHHKRTFAAAYARWVQLSWVSGGGDSPSCEPLSFMAAQAVRIDIRDIYNELG